MEYRRIQACLAAIAGFGLLFTGLVATAEQPLPPDVQKLLAKARQATAKYHDRAKAEADGYIDIDLYIPGMGWHYLNPGLMDGTFDPARPEALVYSPDSKSGRLKLVAVEYLVPCGGPCVTPPDGYPGNHDNWSVVDGTLWALHAWVWLPNPHGMFASHNPRLD